MDADKLIEELKRLPPAWWGAIAGAVAAGATLFPNHRVFGGLGAGALVYFLARKATQPCCADCANKPQAASSSSAAIAATEPAAELAIASAGDDIFGGDGSAAITTSGAAAGGDLFPDSASLSGGCPGCTSSVSEGPAFSLVSSAAPSPIATATEAAPVMTAPAPSSFKLRSEERDRSFLLAAMEEPTFQDRTFSLAGRRAA